MELLLVAWLCGKTLERVCAGELTRAAMHSFGLQSIDTITMDQAWFALRAGGFEVVSIEYS